MSHGDRTGPMGQGPKTERTMGYCSGSYSPGHMTGVTACAGRGAGLGAGRGMGRGAGRGAGVGFRRRRTPGFGRGGGFATQGEYSGYYYPAPAQTRAKSNLDSFENRIRSLKQELETLMESLKRYRLQARDEKE
ncbi:hypothetical protein FXV91_05885 [Methanosarcina sp. DH2]|nr:hypothetical protein [Methanosarcina sp. DH2]